MDFVDLVKLVLSWKEWEEAKQFEEHAAEPPHIHFIIIITICKQALRRSIPAGGYIFRVRLLAIDPSAGTKVDKFYVVPF